MISVKKIVSIEKDIKTIKSIQSEMKSTIYGIIKNTLKGINSRLDEAEDQISDLDKKKKNTQDEQQKEKRILKN